VGKSEQEGGSNFDEERSFRVKSRERGKRGLELIIEKGKEEVSS